MIIKPLMPIWWTPSKQEPSPDKVYACLKCKRTTPLLPQQGTCPHCGHRAFTIKDRADV